MSQQAEELVRHGQPRNLMSTPILMWEITTIAGILIGVPREFGVTPLTQIRNGNIVMSKGVMQHTTVRKAIHWVPAIQERGMSQQAEELVRLGQLRNLMSMTILVWGSITTAGIQIMIIMEECGASLLTQIRNGSIAMSKVVMQHTTVRKVIHWVSVILEA